MAVTDNNDSLAQTLPDSFPLSVILESRPSTNAWAKERWQAVGVSVGAAAESEVRQISEQAEVRRYLYPGFKVSLHLDECESYYFNLMSERPRCFIIADVDDSGRPTPLLVSLSFDEAHAYLEGDRDVYAVDIPPELYRWTEAYVLANYVSERKTKRKLEDWKAGEREQQA